MSTPFITDLDTPLLKLNAKDVWTARDSHNGAICYGSIGSGKSSGWGRASSGALLRANYGFLVLCAKPEEVEFWKANCKQHGRENSMVVFDKTRHFNFLTYEFAKKGVEGANSATDLLMRVIKTADRAAGQGGGREGDAIWQLTTREMILNTITVLFAVLGTVKIEDIVQFVTSMPTQQPATEEERRKTSRNFSLGLLTALLKAPRHPLPRHTVKRLYNYWFHQFPKTPEKMRGSILACVAANLNRFTDGILRECFCTTTDLVPEMVLNGAVIIMGFPTLVYQEEGIVAQQLFKQVFQRMVENRNSLAPEFRERSVALYADECQYFVNEYDDTFLSTCRGSRCAVVYLTQSLPSLYAQLGKEKSDFVDGFTGKFSGATLFCRNSCPKTNTRASQLIGRGLKTRTSEGSSTSQGMQTNRGGDATSIDAGWNQSSGTQRSTTIQHYMENLVEPNFFSSPALKTGAKEHNYQVTAVWFKAGGNFAEPMPDTNSNTLLVTFSQR